MEDSYLNYFMLGTGYITYVALVGYLVYRFDKYIKTENCKLNKIVEKSLENKLKN